ncbi:YggS family pyridoxal phosphate-dependent enzyme [Luteibacter aegosomatissinici]|uniref:YggS family pyridoxal phosphate-dependent enzyme n=1 Tax=Luteibacter aegosomatissinici TaxID=2911539 RepID=UPI001FF89AA0|nr:YggS family pyridoxal phosphate-dependent enzyme [Luteibacter aegosomatissinici]UPG93207.1 YggS family pyridoxal phosphate-dependent enzyme [Luteibacter aegosomatissinici]
MTGDLATLAGRLAAVRAGIDAACREAGRDPAEVALLPVSKTFGADVVAEATQLGLRRFGENKVQEIQLKAAALAADHLEWVVIGHLQTNKAKAVVALASEVQSLDRLDLAVALDKALQAQGRAIDVLVQVKTSSEDSKSGLAPGDLLAFLRELRAFSSLRVRGLMTIAEHSEDAGLVRANFRDLYQCRNRARDAGFELERLSMGMSGDYGLAIAEGSTEVRVGSSIFGARNYKH